MLNKALDLLRTLGWAIVNFIYSLIDSLFDILKEINALDIVNSISNESMFRKLYSGKWYEMVNNLFDINIADRLGQENPLQNSSDLTDSYYLKELLNQLKNSEWQFEMKDLAIDGEKLMKYFKLRPSRIVWELLRQAFDWVLTDINNRNNEKEILNYLENFLKNKKMQNS